VSLVALGFFASVLWVVIVLLIVTAFVGPYIYFTRKK